MAMPPPGYHHLNEDMDLTRRSVGPPAPPPPPLPLPQTIWPQSSQSFYMSSGTAHTATSVGGTVHQHMPVLLGDYQHMPVLLGDYRVVMHPHHPHHHLQQQQPGSSHLPSQYHAHHG
ncbi:unnamed protein product [Vitrella brassicaformis CCMP3155]|uniref:Uncharacterized protein n=2 Tax=Vitrella brassicaformis TaxID=1169539 RepID=A0A0G4GPK8_VITBC|nr:unnamed protein product [Vitrella brassicaformis CCMP3155]|mmetsp:Transcript_34750/g.86175  ORF Transcript_34750/g.86175 Transcript_34750/m.86175 type:complete len:117 (+) Transcript_34750:70-420(+)|eukprot:CEM32293.1 unnamed protein product [Vitrella brassicaformis CCMP3155]